MRGGHQATLIAANNLAFLNVELERYDEARLLLRKMMSVAQRVLGESNEITLRLRWIYARALFEDADATLDNLHEALTMLEETQRIARRVFGGEHPLTTEIRESCFRAMREGQAALRARGVTPPLGDAS